MWEKQWQRLPKHANYIKLQHGNLDMQTKRWHFCRHLLQELFWNAARTPTSPRDKIPSCRAQRQSCDCKNSSQASRPLLKQLWPLPSGLNSVRFSGEWQEQICCLDIQISVIPVTVMTASKAASEYLRNYRCTPEGFIATKLCHMLMQVESY